MKTAGGKRATNITISPEEHGERIIEFSRIVRRRDGPPKLLKGFISFVETIEGMLRVDLYNLDEGVSIIIPFHNGEDNGFVDHGDD